MIHKLRITGNTAPVRLMDITAPLIIPRGIEMCAVRGRLAMARIVYKVNKTKSLTISFVVQGLILTKSVGTY
jgi:hypothetical protein